MWNRYGCRGNLYPGYGQGFLGKPNVYLRNFPKNSKIEVSLSLQNKTQVLATVPALNQSKWVGLFNTDFIQGVVHFPYLFHDLRVDTSKMQFKAGFCEKRENLMSELSTKLTASGFSKSEIQDFQTYWSLKMPSAENYCVYPQTNEQMNQVARLDVSPSPSKIVRLNFFIIPTDQLPDHLKALRTPASAWLPSKSADSKETSIFEWGVGFLAVD